jgi:Mu DNA binding, I gamma subdomain/Mu transposase, C-terminal
VTIALAAPELISLPSPWVPLLPLANDLGIDPTTLRRWIWNGEVDGRERTRGRGYEVNVLSLPSKHKSAFLARHPELISGAATTESASTTGSSARYNSTRRASVRERADDRAEAVLSFRTARASRLPGETLAQVEQAWLAEYRRTHPQLRVSIRSVKDWDAKFSRDGIDGLVDRNDGSKQKGSRIPEEAKRLFRDLFLRAHEPNLFLAYREVVDEAAARGWGAMPCYRSFYRYAESVPKMARMLAREKSDHPRSVLPYVRRDPTSVPVYHTIQGDHRVVDVGVSCGSGTCGSCYLGHHRRVPGHHPVWTVWVDTHSRYIVAHELSIDPPNTARTLRGIGRMIVSHGVMARLYVDNGTDFVSALGDHLPAARNNRVRREKGLAPLEKLPPRLAPLGTEVVYARPGNPEGKGIVESVLKTFRRQFDERFDSMRRDGRTAFHRDALPNVSEIAYLLQLAVERYNTTPHGGFGMNGRTPADVFNDPALRLPRRDADPTTFALIFFEPLAGGRFVGRLGVRVDGRIYRLALLEKQFEYFGQRVDVRVNADDPRVVILLDRKTGAYICEAHLDELRATYDTRDEITRFLIARTFRDVYALRRMAARAVGGDVRTRLAEHAAVMLAYYERLLAGEVTRDSSAVESLTFLARLRRIDEDTEASLTALSAEENLSADERFMLRESNRLAHAGYLDAEPKVFATSDDELADEVGLRTEAVRIDARLCEHCDSPVGLSRVYCISHEVELGWRVS